MGKRLATPFSLLVLISISYLQFQGCAKPAQSGPQEEAPDAPTSVPASSTPAGTAAASPAGENHTPEPAPPPSATAAEARSALARVYKDLVTLESPPEVVVGDFNGDGSQDIAMAVRPDKAKLADINSELAGWIIRDARTVTVPDPAMKRDPKSGPLRPKIGEKDDRLLVVIHGYGAKGWRDPEAQQTFLLRNAAGDGMQTATRKSLLKVEKKPPLVGDSIKETIGGISGFLYYTGAAYAWFDPRTFKPDPPRVNPH